MRNFFFPILCSSIGIILTTGLIVYLLFSGQSPFENHGLWDDWSKTILLFTILIVVDLFFIGIIILCKKESKLQNQKLFQSNTFKRF